MVQPRTRRAGFALPTVLIASVVMLSILAVSVSSVVAVRTSLKVQYYEQLAKEAGEAGIAYAQACLAQNANVPQWSDANPLTPGTDCDGTPALGVTCPDDDECFVLATEQFRTSFSLGSPTLDDDGRALTLPNTGYIELLRQSNGEVWRSYSQPAVQAAVVPDLCSGAATNALGWQNAVVTSSQQPMTAAPAALTISAVDGDAYLGHQFFRKDINITEAGQYRISLYAPGTNIQANLFVNGSPWLTSTGSENSSLITLDAGCHLIEVRLTNNGTSMQPAQFSAAVHRDNAAPVALTDSSWRVSVGADVPYSAANFYQSNSRWGSLVTYSTYSELASFDPGAQSVATSTCTSSCPSNSTTYYRAGSNFTLASNTVVQMATMCDDSCQIFINGVQYSTNTLQNTFVEQEFMLPAGTYRVGARVYNSSGASRFGMSLKTLSGTVLTRTTSGTSWRALNAWVSGSFNDANDPRSYETTYVPSPLEMPAP